MGGLDQDGVEVGVRRHGIGLHHRNAVSYPSRQRVSRSQIERTLVDVNGRDHNVGRRQGRRNGNRPPPAANIQDATNRNGHRAQQYLSAEVDVVRGEDAGRHFEREVVPSERHGDAPTLVRGRGSRAEVVVLAHATRIPGTGW